MGLLSWLLAGCSKSAKGFTPEAAKVDADKLVAAFIPFAEKQLKEHKSFHPFGGVMKVGGKIVAVEISTRGDPKAEEVVKFLHEACEEEAAAGESQACIVVSNVMAIPPGESAKRDAILAEVDHISGYSVDVFFPYSFPDSGGVNIGAPFGGKAGRTLSKQS